MTTYYDLLQPRWKGKINITDPTLVGRGRKWFAAALFYKSLDIDFMKSLSLQEPMVTRDRRLQIEWVAQGKHLASLLPSSEMYREFLQAGAPLTYIRLKESKLLLEGGSSGVSLMDKMPHPQAAKLFINWYLSKEGQTVFSRSYMYQSFRVDVPIDHLDPETVRDPKFDYPVENEDFLDETPRFEKMAKDIFSPLLK